MSKIKKNKKEILFMIITALVSIGAMLYFNYTQKTQQEYFNYAEPDAIDQGPNAVLIGFIQGDLISGK